MDRLKSLFARAARMAVLLGALNLCMGSDCAVSEQRCWPQDALVARLTEVYDASAQSTYNEFWVPTVFRDASTAPPSCGGFDGLGPGSDVSLTVIGGAPGNWPPLCTPQEAIVDGLELVPREVDFAGNPRSTVYAQGDLTLPDGCRGEWGLVFASGADFPGVTDAPWTPGEVPPAIWVRYFRTTVAENCPTLPPGHAGTLACADVWAGEIREP